VSDGCDLLRGRLSFGVFAAEAFDASCGVDQFLLAGEEWVASGADFDVDVSLMGGASFEARAARANDTNFVIVGMNSSFRHDYKTFPAILLYFKRD
jgi:hypothetical protein